MLIEVWKKQEYSKMLTAICKGLLVVVLMSDVATANDHLNYALTDKGRAFIKEMTGKFGYTRQELQTLFEQVSPDKSVLQKISKPAEKTMQWFIYRKIFSDQKRLKRGIKFYYKHQNILDQAYEKYGVPQAIIVAILGIETGYGRVTGDNQVIRALATIAFDYPEREKFFTKELRAFLQMTKEEKIDPLSLKGSYAGAMGMTQFMPSSYLNFAVDYDGDGYKDMWKNPGDAIFSIAHYLAENGWQRNQSIVEDADLLTDYKGQYNHKPFTTLAGLKAQGVILKSAIVFDSTAVGLLKLAGEKGSLYFVTFKNFAVITTYNTSPLYAMAVNNLAKSIIAKL
ncbi:MAG: lytic murein transglycosylase B [Ostreibacterium sp.]